MADIGLAVEWAIKIAEDQSHGYSLDSRTGNPDYDCSSLVYYALENAGFGIVSQRGYPGNCETLWPDLEELGGWQKLSWAEARSSLVYGDILCNPEEHCAFYMGNGKTVEAHGVTHGSAAPGDQGDEIGYGDADRDSWVEVYRCTGGGINIKIVDTNLQFKNLSDRPSTKNIIVHHTGTDTDKDMSAAEIHNMHKDGQGWSGIGYHYVIRKDGTIEKGRPDEKKGAHCEDQEMNVYAIGIVLSGTFNGDVQPTQGQIDSLVNLIALMCKKYSLSVDRDVIKGHREVSNTNCPGDNLFKVLDEVVTRARDIDPTKLTVNAKPNDPSSRTPHSGDDGIRVTRLGKDTVKLTKLPEKKVFAEPIYPDYITVSDTVPQWVLDQTMQMQKNEVALKHGKSIPDGDAPEKGPNGMHYYENDIKFLMNEPNNMTREQAIEVLSKDKKYTQKVVKNADGTFGVVEETAKVETKNGTPAANTTQQNDNKETGQQEQEQENNGKENPPEEGGEAGSNEESNNDGEGK